MLMNVNRALLGLDGQPCEEIRSGHLTSWTEVVQPVTPALGCSLPLGENPQTTGNAALQHMSCRGDGASFLFSSSASFSYCFQVELPEGWRK